VQHTASMALFYDSWASIDSHDFELTPECNFSFLCAFLHDRSPPGSSPWELKDKVILPHFHAHKLTN
jgi:hypothetical protein